MRPSEMAGFPCDGEPAPEESEAMQSDDAISHGRPWSPNSARCQSREPARRTAARAWVTVETVSIGPIDEQHGDLPLLATAAFRLADPFEPHIACTPMHNDATICCASVAAEAVGAKPVDLDVAKEALRRSAAELAHAVRLQSMGELSASITHEIRQPLHAIATFASACQRALDSGSAPSVSDLNRWTGQISKQARRVSAVVARLRALFRPGAECVTAPFDFNELVRETVEMLRAEIRRRGVRLELELGDDISRVNGDELQIFQIIVNLVRNAIDAMAETPPGSRWLRLTSEVLDGRWVQLTVKDAGPGISEESAARIFEPLYSTKPKGMDMGLAISRSIAQAHHGQLIALSQPQQGATFCLRLPLEQADAHEAVLACVHRG